MRNELPEGWTKTVLGEIIELNPKTIEDDDKEASFIPMTLVPTGYSQTLRFETKKWGDIKKGYTHFKDGDVILAKITPCFENSKAAYIKNLKNGIGAGSTEFYVFRSISNLVDARLLFAFVKTKSFLKEGEYKMTGTVGHKRVPKTFILNYPFPLPPLNEQRRIADKLDKIMPRIDGVTLRLERLPTLIKRFRQSVLTAAVTGKLTEKWRQQHPDIVHPYLQNTLKLEDLPFDLPKSWILCQINDVTKNSFYGPRFNRKDYVEQGIPTIRTTDFTSYGAISLKSDTPKLKLTNEQIEKYKLEYGDILITRTGTIGAMAIFKEKYIAIPSAYLIRFRLIEDANNDYIFHYMQSIYFQGLMGLKQSAVTQPNLNAEKIKSLPIPLPPLEEQEEIVRQVDNLFAFADKLELHYKKAKEKIHKMPQAILAKAFRGQLVPQNPDLPAPQPGKYWVYVIKCKNNSNYIGQTNNLRKRWSEHLAGEAADWTKRYPPLYVMYWEECHSRNQAVKREKELKSGFGRKWIKREESAGRLWRAGEPASILLEKIKSQKDHMESKSKSTKRKK